MDIVSSVKRSQMMSGIRGKDTKPEIIVRQAAHALGYRFRVNRRDLPGSPDIVFPGRKTVLFVHGCYWHRHDGCKYCYSPKSNIEFWERKFRDNVLRDIRVQRELQQMGWRVAVIWECEAIQPDGLRQKLKAYLQS
jgi:DNA mismatch endonuclease (patch repair protein)